MHSILNNIFIGVLGYRRQVGVSSVEPQIPLHVGIGQHWLGDAGSDANAVNLS